MTLNDIQFVLQWWTTIFLLGLIALPINLKLFPRFIDKGYIFSKVFGLIIISYCMLLLGALHVLSFSYTNTLIVVGGMTAVSVVFLRFNKPNITKSIFIFFILEELLFFLALLFWSYVRAHNPDIHGLEKYMDFGFVNSILKSSYFPPKDMWFTPFAINYYYFGHLMSAVLIQLSKISSSIGYNLMIATLFAFAFTCSFSIAINLLSSLKNLSKAKLVLGGILTAFLLSLGGNIHTLYSFFLPYNTENPIPFWNLIFSPESFPNGYWYPNATRFIYNTIHEFPVYSFIVSDLHGHVISIPIVLTIVAVMLHLFMWEKRMDIKKLIFISFLLSAAYMTNALDGLVYLLFVIACMIGMYVVQKKNILQNFTYISEILAYMVILLCGLIFFSLPFSLHFKPFISGIGVLCAPEFLISLENIGPFLFEKDHCHTSPVWQLFILHGFFYIWIFTYVWILIAKKKLEKLDIFIVCLTIVATILIIIPEFIYFKDIYPAHYRANTMFKFVYQAFMLLSIASGYIIIRLISNFKFQISNVIFVSTGCIALFFVSIYPYFAIPSYYGGFKAYRGLEGTTYLKELYPSDFAAIEWMNNNLLDQPVILEAHGDSYTDYARVSTHTGLPTVLGWTVHEWLWRGSYTIPAPRISEIQTIYETKDRKKTNELIKKYNISYVFIGDLERQKYPLLYEEKFLSFGKIIYQNRQTKIYQITQ